MYSCLFIPNCIQNHVITQTKHSLIINSVAKYMTVFRWHWYCCVLRFSKLKKCLYIFPVGFTNSSDHISNVLMNVHYDVLYNFRARYSYGKACWLVMNAVNCCCCTWYGSKTELLLSLLGLQHLRYFISFKTQN